jgi:hypothetical protein
MAFGLSGRGQLFLKGTEVFAGGAQGRFRTCPWVPVSGRQVARTDR